jgi:hypothetical protein
VNGLRLVKRGPRQSVLGASVVSILLASASLAHITPAVILVSDRDAALGLLAGAKRSSVREVRLSPEDRQAIQQQWVWSPEERFYRFYLGRDEQRNLIAVVVFLTEFTIHGPVRVAVGLAPDGRVKGAAVVELTEESYKWLKPALDLTFTRDFIGQDSRGRFGLSDRLLKARGSDMLQFYAQVVASLIQRGAILYEVAVLKRGAGG